MMIAGISSENGRVCVSVCVCAVSGMPEQASLTVQTESLTLAEQRVLSYISGVCESEGTVPAWAVMATCVLGGLSRTDRASVIESLETKGAILRVSGPEGEACLCPAGGEHIQEGEQ